MTPNRLPITDRLRPCSVYSPISSDTWGTRTLFRTTQASWNSNLDPVSDKAAHQERMLLDWLGQTDMRCEETRAAIDGLLRSGVT
jgi:hypothetical protein